MATRSPLTLSAAGIKPVYILAFSGHHYGIYVGVIALAANFAVAVIANLVIRSAWRAEPPDVTQAADYEDAV